MEKYLEGMLNKAKKSNDRIAIWHYSERLRSWKQYRKISSDFKRVPTFNKAQPKYTQKTIVQHQPKVVPKPPEYTTTQKVLGVAGVATSLLGIFFGGKAISQ
jgi:hypothetical protein